VSFGQTVQETGALLAGALDLGTDLTRCSHVIEENGRRAAAIPGTGSAVAELVDAVLV
jgi:hypothetical protein